MGEKLSDEELQRVLEFSKTPRHDRSPEMLLPDEDDAEDH